MGLGHPIGYIIMYIQSLSYISRGVGRGGMEIALFKTQIPLVSARVRPPGSTRFLHQNTRVVDFPRPWRQHGACTHCNALQRTATHCNALQRTATHCTAPHCNTLQHKHSRGTNTVRAHERTLHSTEGKLCHHTCNTLQHTATHCNTLQHTATHCNALHRTAAHCNALQHTAFDRRFR